MCLIVLIQNSKGGGLAAGFASSNQIMGVRKTTDFLEKATWTLAGLMVVISILAAYSLPTKEVVDSIDAQAVEAYETAAGNAELPVEE
jgi:protein translocase SecG subunit